MDMILCTMFMSLMCVSLLQDLPLYKERLEVTFYAGVCACARVCVCVCVCVWFIFAPLSLLMNHWQSSIVQK